MADKQNKGNQTSDHTNRADMGSRSHVHLEDDKYGSKKEVKYGTTYTERQTDSMPQGSSLALFSSRDRLGEPYQRKYSFGEHNQFLDFDDMLPEIGEFGWYQKVLFVLMIPFCFIAAFIYLGQIFLTLPPLGYYCYVEELQTIVNEEERKNLSIPLEKDGSYSKCFMYDRNYTALRASKNRTKSINGSLPTIPCKQGYVYDHKQTPFYSATMEFGWVCNKAHLTVIAQMVFFIGSIFGCMVYAYFADHLGRLNVLVGSCFLGLVGNLFCSITRDFAAFSVSRFIVGASYDTSFTMIFILVFEYIGPKYRTCLANMTLGLFYAPCCCLLPWLALTVQSWRKFSILCCFPIILSLFSFCIMPESARWLVSVGKIDEALNILVRISEINKKKVESIDFEHFRFSCKQFYKEEMQARHNTIFTLCKSRRICRYVTLLIITWMAISLIYDGHVRTAAILSKDVFLIFTLACATEVPGNLLLILTLDRCGRRWCCFAMTVLSGIFSLLATKMFTADQMIIMALISRFFANIAFNIGLQWAAEMLPTVVRVQGIGFIHIMGLVGMVFSPPIVYLSHISVSLVLTILGSIAVICGVLTLLLPETLHQDLPQTLSDGNHFGSEQRCWHIPCCGPGAKQRRFPKRLWHTGSSLRTVCRDEYRSKKFYRYAVRMHRGSNKRASTVTRGDESDEEIQNVLNYKAPQ